MDWLQQAFVASALVSPARDDVERDLSAAWSRARDDATIAALRELRDEAHEALNLIAAGQDHHMPRDVGVAVRQRIANIERNHCG